MNTIINAITSAKEMIKDFCKTNQVRLNEEILATPVKGLSEFFEGRDQSGFNLTREEILEDLDGSEAMVIVDDLTEKSVILYDEEKMVSLAFDDQAQIFIHEYLHFYEALDIYESEGLLEYSDPVDDEAEDELISLLIFFYSEMKIEDGLQNLVAHINPQKLLNAYEDKEIARCMLEKLYNGCVGRNEVVKRLQIR